MTDETDKAKKNHISNLNSRPRQQYDQSQKRRIGLKSKAVVNYYNGYVMIKDEIHTCGNTKECTRTSFTLDNIYHISQGILMVNTENFIFVLTA